MFLTASPFHPNFSVLRIMAGSFFFLDVILNLSLVGGFSPTPLKNIKNWIISPIFGVKIKNL